MSRTKIDILKNLKSWIKDIKFKIKSNNIKLRNWHENNMENFKRVWEKFVNCGKEPKYICIHENLPKIECLCQNASKH